MNCALVRHRKLLFEIIHKSQFTHRSFVKCKMTKSNLYVMSLLNDLTRSHLPCQLHKCFPQFSAEHIAQ